MANRYWGLNRGQYAKDIVEQTADPTKDCAVKIDLAKNLTKTDVLILLEQIKIALMKDIWPPA
jgi:hypothetical protein